MSVTIDLTVQEVAALKPFTKLEDYAKAVAQAAREFLRLSRLRELKTVSGQVEFEEKWRELEEFELGESPF